MLHTEQILLQVKELWNMTKEIPVTHPSREVWRAKNVIM